MSYIYLDNAATTFPKPRAVTDEVLRCVKHYCGNPGRSSHPLALAASNKVYECREQICKLFSTDAPENIVFTQNATYALNMAIKGLLHRGDHVLISDMEHNAVYRPVFRLADSGHITYDIFDTVKNERPLSPEEICLGIEKKILRGRTRMLICTHAPNICSTVLPITEIGKLCKKHGIYFVVDASQSAGHIRIDMSKENIDVLCAPGHKGLMGIQGCGFMILGGENVPNTLIEGGSGVDSLNPRMPDYAPERFEVGTLPTPSIAALSEGIKYVSSFSPEEIRYHENELFIRLRYMLENSPSLCAKIYMPDCPGAVMLFNIGDRGSEETGRFLSKKGICSRSGYHCAPLAHASIGTPNGGAVRVSFSHFNKKSELEALVKALYEFVNQ